MKNKSDLRFYLILALIFGTFVDMYLCSSGFKELVDAIPAAFWGTVAGSFFTLIGVHLTNSHNLKRMISQFEHDDLVNKQNRDLNLKKEVYMESAEAVSVGMECLSRIGNMTIPLGDVMKPYIEKEPIISKMNVIANDETIEALAAFSLEFTAAGARLIRQRNKVDEKDRKKKDLIKQIEDCSEEHKRLVQLQNEGLISTVKVDVDKEKKNNEVTKVLSDRTADLRKQHDVVHKEFLPLYLELSRGCVIEKANLNKVYIPKLLECVRKELELPFDGEKYKKIVGAGADKGTEIYDEYIKSLNIN